MQMMNGGWTGLGGLFMGVFMMLFWVFVIAAIVWLVLTLSRSQTTRAPDDGRSGAVRILEERLARGDIDAEEFRTRRVALEGGGR